MVRNFLPVGRGLYATNVGSEFVRSVFQNIVDVTHQADLNVADAPLVL